ncbi:protein PTHB1 isoform X1 [Anabrus simplex]|uniref:protein PTHB1 isoform X1 n=1 Tax=Anabrus simplex TaxID=316456 RepID=UPI0035A3950D
MSLFKARDFWTTRCGESESFDQQSIVTANIGGNSESIITGSLSGVLRVYFPSFRRLEDGTEVGYKPADLLLETELPQPILQVGVGKLVSGSQNLHLSVLHPRSVAIYNLALRMGTEEHGDQSRLVLAYEHQLRRSAFCMVIGPFGGVSGRDFLCVQSLDGALCFFEQETFAFIRFLPMFLLPGPLVYFPHTDSFLTVSSNRNAECYRYQVLAEAGGSDQDATSGRKITADWSFNLGEAALDVACIAWPSHADVVILGERNLYCLRDNGTLKFMKRLEYKPCCLHSYIAEPDGRTMVLVVTDTDTLLVYDQTTLRWSAQLLLSPVSVKTMNLENLHGVLVFLSESGDLQCCYLGTEPSLFMAPPLEITAIDHDKAKVELMELQKIIKAYSKESSLALMKTTAEREVAVNVNASAHMEPCTFPHRLVELSETLPMCRVSVELLPHSPLSKVQVVFVIQPPLRASQVSHTISSLCERTHVETYIYLYEPGSVSSLDVQVITSYVTPGQGMPRILQTVAQLPLKLVVSSCLPTKEAEFKITINTNQPAVGLAQLFPEFLGEGSVSGASNAIGFLLHGTSTCIVTAMSAKTSQRYRLQSNGVVSVYMLASQLVQRLQKHFSKTKDFHISYSSAVPVQELFTLLDTHLACRIESLMLQEELSQRATQFRMIQRRLLIKFKDKTPTPITNLNILLKDTYELILATADKLEETQNALAKVRCELKSVVHLVLLLLGLSTAATHPHFQDLEAALSATVNSDEEQGWEEITDVAISFLLRTSLAKSVKDQQRSTPLSLDIMRETARFKKHLAAAIERVMKTNPVVDKKVTEEKKDVPVGIPPIPEAVEAPVEEEVVVPTGSRYAERKTSAQSRGRSSGLQHSQGSSIGTEDQNLKDGSRLQIFSGLRREKMPKDLTEVIESPPEIFPSGEENDEMW